MDSNKRDDAEGGRKANERRARESLRETMIQGGMELLDLHGLTLTYQSITYAKVFDYLQREYSVRVTRGSVHERIWASQDEFRREVLFESVRFFPPSNVSLALVRRAASASSTDRFAKELSSDTYPRQVNSPVFGQFQEAKALASRLGDSEATSAIQALFRQRSEGSIATSRARFPSFLAALGLQTRTSLGLSNDEASDLFNVIVGGLVEGTRLNVLAGSFDLSEPIDYLAEPADSTDPWCALSVGVRSFVELLFEPAENPADVEVEVPEEMVVGKTVPDDLLHPTSRRSRECLQRLVLTAGVELFLQDGLKLVPELLGYASVFAHLKTTRGEAINRASVHRRIWESNDDYRTDVLSTVLTSDARETRLHSEMMRDVAPVVTSGGVTDMVRSRNAMLRELGVSLSSNSSDTPSRRRLLQVKAALSESQESATTSRLRAAVKQSDIDRLHRNEVEVQDSLIQQGFRVRPSTGLSEQQGLELFSMLSMTAVAGLTLNRLAGVAVTTQPVALRVDGEDEDEGPTGWTPPAVAMLAFFEQLYEPVDAA